MVIDVAKGVEERTIKLMDVCRLRDTPILTFVNKLDREGRDADRDARRGRGGAQDPVRADHLAHRHGQALQGRLRPAHDRTHLFSATHGGKIQSRRGRSRDSTTRASTRLLGDRPTSCARRWSWCRAPAIRSIWTPTAGEQTPVFFGSAINNFGVKELLDAFVEYAPPPRPREPESAPSSRGEQVHRLRVQDPGEHGPGAPRPRRLPAGLLRQLQEGHEDAPCAHRQDRAGGQRHHLPGRRARHVEEAWPGDIIGLHNHGTIQIGDTFTEGEDLKYVGMPYFAPELFRRVVLKDPLKTKAAAEGRAAALRGGRDPGLPAAEEQ
jgi:peptide chain release factor 3